jgi:hypothetical protein
VGDDGFGMVVMVSDLSRDCRGRKMKEKKKCGEEEENVNEGTEGRKKKNNKTELTKNRNLVIQTCR